MRGDPPRLGPGPMFPGPDRPFDDNQENEEEEHIGQLFPKQTGFIRGFIEDFRDLVTGILRFSLISVSLAAILVILWFSWYFISPIVGRPPLYETVAEFNGGTVPLIYGRTPDEIWSEFLPETGESSLLDYVFSEETWWGVVYPDRDNLLYDIPLGYFDSRGECLNRTRSIAATYPNAQYECGRNCELSPNGIMMVCEETVE